MPPRVRETAFRGFFLCSDVSFPIPLSNLSKKAPLHHLTTYAIIHPMSYKQELELKLEPGQQINGVTYLRDIGIKTYACGSKARVVECRCECGKVFTILLGTLLLPRRHVCKVCFHKDSPIHTNMPIGSEIQLVYGDRFGRLTYMGESTEKRYSSGVRYRRVWCRCDCGQMVEISARTLIKPTFHACRECLNRHQSLPLNNLRCLHPRLWSIHQGMIYRCHYAKKGAGYKHYRARGIIVCDEWRNSFEAFVSWALSHGYDSSLSIDRIDVDGNYEPNNCRWADAKMQANNQRPRKSNIFTSIRGERIDLKTASEKYHIPYQRIYYRYRNGFRGEILVQKTIDFSKKTLNEKYKL